MTWETFHVWFIWCDLWIGLTSVVSPDQTKINLNYSRNLTVRIQCHSIENQLSVRAACKTCRKRQTRALAERAKWGMHMTEWYLWVGACERWELFQFAPAWQGPGGHSSREWDAVCVPWHSSVPEAVVAQAQNLRSQSQLELRHARRKGRVWTLVWAGGRALEVKNNHTA